MRPPRDLDHLISEVSRLHVKRADQAFRDLDLRRGQSPLLAILVENDGLRHSDLAKRLQISAPAVSKTIQRLEGSGYVVRKADPDDERVSRVFITESGKNAFQHSEARRDDLQHDLEVVLSATDREELFRMLLTLRDYFKAQLDSKAYLAKQGED